MAMINAFFGSLRELQLPAAESSVRRWICEAALQSSPCHLWAAGWSGSISQLSVPPPQTHARAFDACSCLSHPGENHLDRNKMKSLYVTSWQTFNRTVYWWYYYWWFLFHVLLTSCQLVRCCLQTLCRINPINTCTYIAPKWKLGQHLLSLSSREIRTFWTDVLKNIFNNEDILYKSIKSMNTKFTLNGGPH